MSRSIAFLSTLFPVRSQIARDFFSSLSKQTEQEFDLVVVNDGFTELKTLLSEFNNLNVIELKPAGSIAKNRESLIKYAVSVGYEIGIFGDFDDFFSDNRVEECLRLLLEYDIVVNELISFDGVSQGKCLLGERFRHGQPLFLSDILEKNLFGLSNTAIRLTCIRKLDFEFDPQLVAVDWYFFSVLLLRGLRSVFTVDAQTLYRQHGGNTAGVNNGSERSLLIAIDVKLTHYLHLQSLDQRFRDLLEKYISLKESTHEPGHLARLVVKNSQQDCTLLWWEIIE